MKTDLTCTCGHTGPDVIPTHHGVATCLWCVTTFPKTLDTKSTREEVIAWLCGNDRNGCYSDEDMVAEGWEPMTLTEAWQQVALTFEDDLVECAALLKDEDERRRRFLPGMRNE